MLLNVIIGNPKTNVYDISNVSVELVGIATNPDYSDIREIPTHTGAEFEEYDFFSYPSNLPNTTKLEGKVISPGKSNKDINIVLAASDELALGTYYPVFNVTFQTPDGLNTIEVKDPATINIEIVKVPWYKSTFQMVP
ncbi:MAG: hypothetical protein R2883_02540 [Caldisericia bacterium]